MWIDSDVEAALAWQEEQSCRCPGCGWPTDVSTAPGAAFIAEPIKCAVCSAKHAGQKGMRDDGGDPSSSLWAVREAPPLVAEE